MARISLLGIPKIETPGGVVTLERRSAILLTHLAVEGPTPKFKMAGWLWPESKEKTARNNLSQLLRRLRLAGADVVTGVERIALCQGVETDLQRISYLETPSLELIRQNAELLAGFVYDDIPEFDDWLSAVREELRVLRLRTAEIEANRLEAAGNLRTSLEYARLRMRLDPLVEDAYRQVARLTYLLGDKSTALRTLEQCLVVLDEELGLGPERATLELKRIVERNLAIPDASSMTASPALPVSILRPPKLVGREREWQQMEEAWVNGQGILISGAPGVGKTRLMLDFVATKGNHLPMEGRPGDFSVPYATHTRTLRQTLAAFPQIILEPWVRRELARVLPELGEAPSPITSAEEKLRFFEAEVWLLRQVSRHQPLINVWDDIQYVDPASVEAGNYSFSAFWGDPNTPVHTVMTYRRGELGAELQAAVDQALEARQLVLIELEPLEPVGVVALLQELDLPTNQDLAPWLSRYTGGNPMFALETLKYLVETGTLGDSLPMRLAPPGRVAALIERRLQRLSPDALNLAWVASVAGSDFTLELAAAVLERSPLELTSALFELEVAQILQGERFSHDLLFEAVFAGIPVAVRRILHTGVARWLGQNYGHPAVVARHWLDAGRPREALSPLLESARLAEESGLAREAADAFTNAGDIHKQLGETDRSAELYALAAKLRTQEGLMDAVVP
jgi:DNA-binding SARP family transcriptional activator